MPFTTTFLLATLGFTRHTAILEVISSGLACLSLWLSTLLRAHIANAESDPLHPLLVFCNSFDAFWHCFSRSGHTLSHLTSRSLVDRHSSWPAYTLRRDRSSEMWHGFRHSCVLSRTNCVVPWCTPYPAVWLQQGFSVNNARGCIENFWHTS